MATFFDRTRRRRPADLDATGLGATAGNGSERGSAYVAVRRTVAASQHEFDRDPNPTVPAGRFGAAYVRLDRMYEVAMLVAAACEVAGVPPPPQVVTWRTELVRLRDLRERNACRVRQLTEPSD